MQDQSSWQNLLTEDVYFIIKEIFFKVIQGQSHAESKMLRNELLILIVYLLDREAIFHFDCQQIEAPSLEVSKFQQFKDQDISQ